MSLTAVYGRRVGGHRFLSAVVWQYLGGRGKRC